MPASESSEVPNADGDRRPAAAEPQQARDDLLRLATEAGDVGLWDLDVATGELFWTPSLKAMFGLAPDAVVNLARFNQLLHADDLPPVSEAIAAATDGARRLPYDVAYRVVNPDSGAVRWIAAKGKGIFDASGHCTRLLGTAFDITIRKDAEARQRASAERLELLDTIGEATRGLDEAAAVMQATARILGEFLGATRCAYADVEADNDRFTIRSDWSVAGVPSSAGTYSLDLFGPQATFNLRRGQHLIVNDVDQELGDHGGARMFNAIGIKAVICAGLVKSGRLVAMMAVHQSVPRRWSAQHVAIVGEVVERCWAHIERVRAAALLTEQDRRKDEFLATLAHELRNPLAPLTYAANILGRATEPATAQRARQIIERQAFHMVRLIDDLLDVSRINRGLVELKRTVMPMATMMMQAVEASRPAMERAGHQISFQLPPESVTVDVDPARIVQAITNLLNNAAKYTPDGGCIRLSGWVDGARVVVEVVDNGIGIPPQDQGKLFQLFTQLPHSGARAQGGLGIGLSLVKRLVELHGGAVSVRSDGLDEGSTFRIELPVMAAVSTQVDGPQGTAASTGTGGRRVLVVEDNADGLEMLTTLLSIEGYDVRGASTGPEALRMAAEWPPAVVLLDLGLPLMDGYEVAARLREDPRLAGVRILALTGWGAPRDRERTAAAGLDGHITKPVDTQQLIEQIEGRGQAGAASTPLQSD